MNILVLTSEYPNVDYPRPDWTPVVAYFCRSWVKQGHRVLAIVNSSKFPDFVYGAAKIFPRFAAKKFDVSQGSIQKTGWREEFSFIDQGVEVFNLPIMKLFPGGKYSENVLDRQAERIEQILVNASFEPDVITGHWINPQLFLLVRLKKKHHCKFSFVFHADYTERKCHYFRVNDYIGYIDRVGCRNRYAAESIRRYVSLPEKPFVCSSGIPESYLQSAENIQKNYNEERMTILSAGRLVQYKNFDKLIEGCWIAFPAKNFSLQIVGDGSQQEALKRKCNELGVVACVSLPGRMNRDALQEEMRKSSVFALISANETLGLVYLEAMAQGCLVIASARGGIDGIIVDGENGFLCEQGDASALSEILIKIQAMPIEERKRISSNAQKTVRQYSDSSVAQKYMEEILQ